MCRGLATEALLYHKDTYASGTARGMRAVANRCSPHWSSVFVRTTKGRGRGWTVGLGHQFPLSRSPRQLGSSTVLIGRAAVHVVATIAGKGPRVNMATVARRLPASNGALVTSKDTRLVN